MYIVQAIHRPTSDIWYLTKNCVSLSSRMSSAHKYSTKYNARRAMFSAEKIPSWALNYYFSIVKV